MFISYIEIKGHKQFSLPGIKMISAEFKSAVQIIIGTNGAGKSTLLRELSPLPPFSGDYELGGHKKINIIDKGIKYELESYFAKSTIHKFIRDGENLNVSGKETEQRKLVKDYFGLTPQLFKLMTGELLFSNFTAQARRDWLMAISGMNFEYAMKLYQKVREYHRDSNALVKDISKRHADELEKLAQIGDIVPMRERAKYLSNIITNLIPMRSKNKLKDSRAVEDKIYENMTFINEETKIIIDNNSFYKGNRFIDIADNQELSFHIKKLLEQVEKSDEELNKLYDKKEKLTLLRSESEEGLVIEDEIAKLVKIQELINQLKQTIPFECNRSNYDREVILEFKNEFSRLATSYISNTELKYNRERLGELQSQETNLSNKLSKLQYNANGLEIAIKHHQNMPGVLCPKCHHEFKVNDGDEKILLHSEELKVIKEEIERLIPELDLIKSELNEFNEFRESRNLLMNLFDRFKSVPVTYFKAIVIDKESKGTNTHQLQLLLDNWYDDCLKAEEYLALLKQQEELVNSISLLKKIEAIKAEYEGSKLDDVDVEIELLYRNIESLKDDISQAKRLREFTDKQLARYGNVRNAYLEIDTLLKQFTEIKTNEALEEIILILQTELAGIQTVLSKTDSINHTINNLANYLKEHEVNQKASKQLMDLLSPNSGLIADHIISFLEEFTEELNRYIQQVWEYDIEILPCKVDTEEEIDYKFPVRIANDDRLRKDIIETSKGQLEIINLVFRLVIMSTIDKTILPLYLDEPAESFDERHSENFVRFIKGYIEQNVAEQIFMVSHDFAGHASFINAETLVLDEKNVLNKPPRYNQHVEILYL